MVRTGSLGAALDNLLGQLVDHTGYRTDDDMALLLIERQSIRSGTA